MRIMTDASALRRDPVILGLGGLGALTVAWFLFGPGGATLSWLEQTLLDVGLVVLARRVVRTAAPGSPVRRFWRAMLVAGLFFAAGDAVRTGATAGLLPDAFAATAQPVLVCAGVGLVVWVMLTYPINAQGSERLRLWLDAATLLTAVAVFAWYFAIGGRLGRAGSAELLIAVVSCAIMLLAAFGVIRLLLSGVAPYTAAAGSVGSVSIVGMVVANSLLGTRHGHVATVLLLASCIGFVATPRIQEIQTRSPGRRVQARTWRRYSRLPYLAVLGTQALLVWGLHDLGLETRTWGATIGLAAITGLVLTRQLLAFHDNANLLADLDASMAEARALQEQLRHKATHDTLTRLANRALLDERLQDLQDTGQHVAVLVIDLDDFKDINDTYGHHVGDEVLVAVAERLRRHVRRRDTIARLGGDEFVMLLPDTSPAEAQQIAGRLATVLNEPVVLAGTPLPLHASIGVAAGGSAQLSTLLRTADAVMYQVKQSGKGGYRLTSVPG
jgi:diguanylate cyclase (GGDEF)-like protein